MSSGKAALKRRVRRLAHLAEDELALSRKAVFSLAKPGSIVAAAAHVRTARAAVDELAEVLGGRLEALDAEWLEASRAVAPPIVDEARIEREAEEDRTGRYPKPQAQRRS